VEPIIRLENVGKDFDGATAVGRVSFEVGRGRTCVLVGPSGCGKTTTLKMINRIIEPTRGRIAIRGRDVRDLDPVELRRSIGYVIQQVGLFPHMTIEANVSIVLRLLGQPRRRRRARAAELLDLVGLPAGEFIDRFPSQLSGGQQQRVGVARALAADPEIILMDEPFGAVDPLVRKQLQRELRRIQDAVHKTIVFVTHDLSEAFYLADQIVLMRGGLLVQQGRPEDLLFKPAEPFVTEFFADSRELGHLVFKTVAEYARPAASGDAEAELALPGSTSLLDAIRILAREPWPANSSGTAPIAITDAAGRPSGTLAYRDIIRAIASIVAPAADRRT
jgi:osmoprotectant transport system ATP-binding protein